MYIFPLQNWAFSCGWTTLDQILDVSLPTSRSPGLFDVLFNRQVFGHLGVPRVYSPRSFHERADCSLVLLIRDCPNVETLLVRELVSTATLLIVATEAKKLHTLHVRRNGVIKRCGWPRAAHWSDDFYTWLKHCSQDYDAVEREISQILQTRWTMLSDRDYMKVEVEGKSVVY